jgi:hypothetical protein
MIELDEAIQAMGELVAAAEKAGELFYYPIRHPMCDHSRTAACQELTNDGTGDALEYLARHLGYMTPNPHWALGTSRPAIEGEADYYRFRQAVARQSELVRNWPPQRALDALRWVRRGCQQDELEAYCTQYRAVIGW